MKHPVDLSINLFEKKYVYHNLSEETNLPHVTLVTLPFVFVCLKLSMLIRYVNINCLTIYDGLTLAISGPSSMIFPSSLKKFLKIVLKVTHGKTYLIAIKALITF